MQIAFWSIYHGQCALTSNILAVSIMAAIKRRSVALLQTQFSMNNASLPLIGRDYLPKSFRDTGIDALLRDIKSRPLTKELVRTDSLTLPGLNEKYSYFAGTGQNNREIYERELLNMHEPLIRAVDEHYEYTFIDVSSGYGTLNQAVMGNADTVVVCLNQNRHVLEQYFQNPLRAENVYYLFGNYDVESAYNMWHFLKTYPQIRRRAAAIHHCTDFSDACNNGAAVPYFLKYQDCGRASPNYAFMKSVRDALKLFGIEERS